MRVWTAQPVAADGTMNLPIDGVVVASIYGCAYDDLHFLVNACNAAEQRAVLGTGKTEIWQRKPDGSWDEQVVTGSIWAHNVDKIDETP